MPSLERAAIDAAFTNALSVAFQVLWLGVDNDGVEVRFANALNNARQARAIALDAIGDKEDTMPVAVENSSLDAQLAALNKTLTGMAESQVALNVLLGRTVQAVYALEKTLAAIAVELKPPVPSDLEILIVKGSSMTAKTVKLTPKGNKPKAVMTPITLTAADTTISLVTVDDTGAPVPGILPAAVTTTLVVDNPALLVITPGADNLHWTFTIPAGASGTANVSATLAFVAGTPGPFTASIALTLPTPPAPTPVDLTIVIS